MRSIKKSPLKIVAVKHLYIVRHAKSSWKHPELSDFERPLNNRGKRDAPFMGKLLREERILPDILVTSPAVRALSTARIIAEEVEYEEKHLDIQKRLYLARAGDLMQVVRELPVACSKAMLVGHNPGLTDIAEILCGKFIGNIPTSGIVALRFSVKKWPDIDDGTGDLLFFEYPRKYFPMEDEKKTE